MCGVGCHGVGMLKRSSVVENEDISGFLVFDEVLVHLCPFSCHKQFVPFTRRLSLVAADLWLYTCGKVLEGNHP